MELVRILVVDDYEPWRCFVQSVFRGSSEFEIVGEAADGLEAVRMSLELQPDIVLLDIGLPKLNGFDAAREIHKVSPASKIVFVSLERSEAMLREAQKIGAKGFVSKLDAGDGLMNAIMRALGGKYPLVTQQTAPYLQPMHWVHRSKRFGQGPRPLVPGCGLRHFSESSTIESDLFCPGVQPGPSFTWGKRQRTLPRASS